MRIAAVIPNWNGAHLLATLLPSLAAQTRLFDTIVVVDNGSTDHSVSVAESHGAEVHQLPINAGFAPAVNAGVKRAEADAVVILNNDVELHPQWLARVEARLEDPTAAFVAGKTVNWDDSAIVDGTFDAVSRAACALRCGSGAKDSPYWNVSRRVQFAPMTALLVRKAVFQELGGLDEVFESYLEDVEFGLRCASNGYTGVYEPAAIARHRGSATLGAWSARSTRNIARNQVLLVARHFHRDTLWKFGWPIAVGQALWGLAAIRHGVVAAWISGKIEGLRLFRSVRRTGNARLPMILQTSEQLIAEVQCETGPDWYWRLYFALTPRIKVD